MKAILLTLFFLSNFVHANFSANWKFIDATSDIYIEIEDLEETFTIKRMYIWHPFISFEKNDDLVFEKDGDDFIYKGRVVGEYADTFFDITLNDPEFSLLLLGQKKENDELYVFSVFDIFEIDGHFEKAP